MQTVSGEWGSAGARTSTFTHTVTFSSGDAARYFFNAGGTIKLNFARTGGTENTRNTEWAALASDCGTVTFGHSALTKVGGGGSTPTIAGSSGYWNTTASTVQHFLQADGVADYATNNISVSVAGSGTQGTGGGYPVLTFTVVMHNADVHVSQNNVDGVTTSTVVVASPATTYLTNTWGTPTLGGSSATSGFVADGLPEYLIGKSLRFNSADSAYMSRTIATNGNSLTWTWSGWAKCSAAGAGQEVFHSTNGVSVTTSIRFTTANALEIYYYNNAYIWRAVTTRLLRDVSAWYHIAVAYDSTNATASDRLRVFINGVRITEFSTAPSISLNQNTNMVNTIYPTYLGYSSSGLNGYLSEVNFIDGQALTPTSFGEVSTTTGQWIPKAYVGTYGTNGFYLPFSNGTSTTTLGYDSSGNNNNWTLNNFTRAAGVNDDWMADSPTDNFCTSNQLNAPANLVSASGLAVYYANVSVWASAATTIAVSTGKWYWEVTVANVSGSSHLMVGAAVASNSWTATSLHVGQVTGGYGYYHLSGHKFSNNVGAAYGASYTNGDVIGVALDMDAGTLTFYKNNVSQGVAYTGLVGDHCPVTSSASGVGYLNFGQRAFAYTPPTGFLALSTKNLPEPTIKNPKEQFNVITYRGNGGGQNIGNIVKPTTTYPISKSLRFNSAGSAYMSRTPAGVGNRKTWTWSGWVKRGLLGSRRVLTASATATSDQFVFEYTTTGALAITDYRSSVVQTYKETTAIYRDPSAWYHIHLTIDTTQAVAENRFKLFVNGEQITAFSSNTVNTVQNADLDFNKAVSHDIGRKQFDGFYLDGYLSEVNFIDGQALTPTSFGEADANDVWIPKAYAGTYGTNGFYLPFSDSTSTTTLGTDVSGNGNHWTLNNFSVAAGANNNPLSDTPTNNFCTLNPLTLTSATIANGGLNWSNAYNVVARIAGGIYVSSGKWYFECTYTSNVDPSVTLQTHEVGVGKATETYLGQTSNSWVYSNAYSNGIIANGSSIAPYTGGIGANGQTGMVAMDLDSGKIWFGRQGVWFGSSNPALGTNPAFTNLTGPVTPMVRAGGSGSVAQGTGVMNFGQRPFAYTPPAGFLSMCTDNIATQSAITTTPDLVMIKSRTSATDWAFYDSVRGVTKDLVSNSTAAETTQVNGLQKLSRDGFYISNLAKINTLDTNYVSYLWNKGVTPGFDIVTYTGTAGAQNINHSLGVVPSMIITKCLSAVGNWSVYHKDSNASPATGTVWLNTTNGWQANALLWNNTAPTSTQFSVGANNTDSNNSGKTMVAYCFAEVPGFSKFSKYTGNGSADGPFVYCGFKPKFVMVRRTDAVANWFVVDIATSPINVAANSTSPNLATAESVYNSMDMVSNGFKLRILDGSANASGGTYIFMAFAEAPFKYSNAR